MCVFKVNILRMNKTGLPPDKKLMQNDKTDILGNLKLMAQKSL
jgi:hypothetical protein